VHALRAAQKNVCQYDEFLNNTLFVPTAQFAVLNGETYDKIHHYYGRADTIYHIGQAFGLAMHRMVAQNTEIQPTLYNVTNTSAGTFVSASRVRRTFHNGP
jgi:hypothetical protein